MTAPGRRRAPRRSHGPPDRADHPGPGGVRRVRGDLEGPEHASHPADVSHERDTRHRPARRTAADRRGGGLPERADPRDRDRVRHDQRRRRLSRHGPDARDVQAAAPAEEGRAVTLYAFSLQDPDFIQACYIAAFSLFILGMRLLKNPRTARRGNLVAAVGMAIAVTATLLVEEVGDYGLIALGIAIGTAVGIPAARGGAMNPVPPVVAVF